MRLPDYLCLADTGLRLSGLPTAVLPDRAAVQLAQQEEQPSFVRSFAYANGPAYGLLLDASGLKEWREGLSKRDLGELLASAFKIALPKDLAPKLKGVPSDTMMGRWLPRMAGRSNAPRAGS